MSWYIKVFENYFNFEGRARRKEYWMFVLFNGLVGFGLGLVIGVLKALAHINPPIIMNLYILVTLIPSFSVGVRRLHDSGQSGWWLLCPIYNFVLLLVPGEQGPNRFGPDPKNTPDNTNFRQAA